MGSHSVTGHSTERHFHHNSSWNWYSIYWLVRNERLSLREQVFANILLNVITRWMNCSIETMTPARYKLSHHNAQLICYTGQSRLIILFFHLSGLDRLQTEVELEWVWWHQSRSTSIRRRLEARHSPIQQVSYHTSRNYWAGHTLLNLYRESQE